MATLQLILVLSIAVLASSILAELLPRVSAPLIQVGIGVIICLVAPTPISIDISPDIFLWLFIAPLLYDEAKRSDRTSLLKNRSSVVSLTVGLVVAIMFIVGVLLNQLFPAIPLAAALALGAALGPTDAVAVSSLKREVKLTRRENSLLNGECLLNDASGVVAFQFAIAAAVTGYYSWQEALLDFTIEFFGGIVLGIAFAIALNMLQRKVRDMGLESLTFYSLLDIITPFIVYMISVQLHVSGILGVVACGLLLSSYADRRIGPAISRLNIHQANVWKVLSFVLNGIVFVILGIELPLAFTTSWEQDIINNGTLISLVLAITFIIVFVRFAWLLGMERLHKHPITGKRSPLTKRRVLSCFALTIGGPKGAVTLSIILSIPFYIGIDVPFPQRDLLIFIASGVILCTLLLANFLLPFVSPSPKKSEVTIEYEEKADLRIEVLRNVIQRLSSEQKDSNANATRTVIAMYNRRIQRIVSSSDDLSDSVFEPIKRNLEVDILRHQQKYLSYLLEKEKVDASVAYKLARQLSQREQLLTHHRGSKRFFRMFLRRLATTRRVLRTALRQALPGLDERKSDAAIRELRILVERDTVRYLDHKIATGSSDYPPEILAEAVSSHTVLMQALLRTEPSLVYLAQTLDDTDDIMRKGYRMELEEIQDLYDNNEISRGLMRRMREDVYLMQLDLEDRV